MKKHTFSLRLLILLICAVVSASAFYPSGGGSTAAAAESELRGVWVSTVANIDFPSQQTTDSEVLKKEIDAIMDNCSDMGFNAVFFQVRPASDALYKSDIFPWSRYLTGTQGVAPDNGFDPLAYAVQEAHARNIQLHAWINPYRITNSSANIRIPVKIAGIGSSVDSEIVTAVPIAETIIVGNIPHAYLDTSNK